MDDRLKLLCDWLNSHFTLSQSEQHDSELAAEHLSPLCGDASFRRYFRCQYQQRSWIAVDAPPEKERGTKAFVEISQRLEQAGLCVPHVYAVDLDAGFMLLDDMGQQTFRALIQGTDDAAQLGRLVPLLGELASVNAEGLPVYSTQLLQAEMDEFWQWYLQYHIRQPFDAAEQQQWQQFSDILLADIAQQPQVFVHRDFMSNNLMVTPQGQPGIIDFQDAVKGPLTYDLASLIWDRYISWSRPQLERWMEQARQQMAADVEPQQWQRWCDWVGLQRNLKIIGRFARLNYRDNKDGYIELLPRFIGFVLDVINRYEVLAPYRVMLEARLCER